MTYKIIAMEILNNEKIVRLTLRGGDPHIYMDVPIEKIDDYSFNHELDSDELIYELIGI